MNSSLPIRRGARRKQAPKSRRRPVSSTFSAEALQSGLRRLGLGGLLGLLAVGIISAWPLARDWAMVPMSEIEFSGYSGGEFSGGSVYGASEEELLELSLPLMGDSYWELDVEKIKRAVETHPWVREATVSKRWPEKVIVGVDEFSPVARWNNTQLLSMQGHLFAVENIADFSHLPHFSVPWRVTPNRETIQVLVDRYNRYQLELANAGLEISEMNYITPQNVVLTANNGLTLFLGTTDHLRRLSRFAGFVDRLELGYLDKVATIDLRYPDGIAVARRVVEQDVSLKELADRNGRPESVPKAGDAHG